MFSQAAARIAGLAGALLGWRPDEFWNSTPAELAAILGAMAGDGAQPLAGEELGRLMEIFPDG